METPQNYIPVYDRFFKLNATNWNHINLNTRWAITDILAGNQVEVSEEGGEKAVVDAFFKYSPLLDPNRYLAGGYEEAEIALPDFVGATKANAKLKDVNNASYVDSFFYYLTAQMKNQNGFLHGLDFYGSYLGIKKKFEYVLEDEYLLYSTFFQTNHGKLFTCENGLTQEDRSRRFRPPLEIGEAQALEDCPLGQEDVETPETILAESGGGAAAMEEVSLGEPDNDVFPFDEQEVVDMDIRVDVPASPQEEPLQNTIAVEEVDLEMMDDRESVSDSDEDEEWADSDDTSAGEGSGEAYEDDESDDSFMVKKITIERFPVQAIAMEKCQATFDSLIDDIKPDELVSALFQIIMILEAYQRAFDFTHNDLHTNNVMYVTTELEFLYYKVNGKTYKVPTHGKLYKIIDFGRSIYKYKGMQFMSDSFHPNGDAATQYNFGPYFDASKPVLEPNPSFDLCRLACSMVDVLPQTEGFAEVAQVLKEWCSDDKGRDVVFKPNGEERYPNFRLYKMIARTVHNHTPLAQLKRPLFQSFVAKGKADAKGKMVMDLDGLLSAKM